MSEPPISGQGLKKGNPNPLYVINSKPTGMSACIHKEVDDWPDFFGVVMRLTFVVPGFGWKLRGGQS